MKGARGAPVSLNKTTLSLITKGMLANIPFVIRLRVVLLRDTGAPLAPFNAWQIIQGLETVGLRMKQHCSNAEKVVTFLETQKKVQNVIYPTNHQGEIKERALSFISP